MTMATTSLTTMKRQPTLATFAFLVAFVVGLFAGELRARAENAPPAQDNTASAASAANVANSSRAGVAQDVVVIDNTRRRLALVYGLFWLVISLFVGRIVWMLVVAARRLDPALPSADLPEAPTGGGHLQVAPANDPDNPFRQFQSRTDDDA
ncbi:MAG: hypothetical protein AB7S36_13465 [Planctomycetota bacterium]